jgi:hypothetical protein
MAKKKVVLLQNEDGTINRVRIDGTEIEVQSAGPVVTRGSIGVSLTLTDVEVSAEVVSPNKSETKSRG